MEYADQVQDYFAYHVNRKNNLLDYMRDQVLVKKHLQSKLLREEQASTWMIRRTRTSCGEDSGKQQNKDVVLLSGP